jgi:hypothetical protein
LLGFLDAGKLDDDRPYFVMEYVDGKTIDAYIASHQPAVLDKEVHPCSPPAGHPPQNRRLGR